MRRSSTSTSSSGEEIDYDYVEKRKRRKSDGDIPTVLSDIKLPSVSELITKVDNNDSQVFSRPRSVLPIPISFSGLPPNCLRPSNYHPINYYNVNFYPNPVSNSSSGDYSSLSLLSFTSMIHPLTSPVSTSSLNNNNSNNSPIQNNNAKNNETMESSSSPMNRVSNSVPPTLY